MGIKYATQTSKPSLGKVVPLSREAVASGLPEWQLRAIIAGIMMSISPMPDIKKHLADAQKIIDESRRIDTMRADPKRNETI